MARARNRVTWKEVVGCLPYERAECGGQTARERTVLDYRAGDFSPDDFERSRRARERAADALTRTEDKLELTEVDARDPRTRDRLKRERGNIRAVRRRLELELWP